MATTSRPKASKSAPVLSEPTPENIVTAEQFEELQASGDSYGSPTNCALHSTGSVDLYEGKSGETLAVVKGAMITAAVVADVRALQQRAKEWEAHRRLKQKTAPQRPR